MEVDCDTGQVIRQMVSSTGDIDALEAGGWERLLPGWTLAEALEEAARRYPDKPAIVQIADDATGAAHLSFADYRNQVFRAANLFHGDGKDGDAVIAVIMPFLPAAMIAMWGGGIAGRYVPINPFLDVEHVAAILVAAGATTLVTVPPSHGAGVWDRIDAVLEQAPCIRQVWLASADLSDPRSFEAALSRQSTTLQFASATDPGSECAYLHTGGTTGSPKLVRHTHQGQLLQGWLCGMAMGAEADVVFGHAMPNFHVGGAIASGTRGIVYGQTIVTLTADGFRNPKVMARFWDIVREQGITAIVTAPTTAAGLASSAGDGPASLTRYTTGGGPLPLEVARTFKQQFGIDLKEVWGGTEFHGILSFHYDGDVAPRLGSCGRVVPFHRVLSAILDGNRFVREAGPEDRGVLIATGPTVIPGYVDPAADASFFVEHGPDGLRWATTGDIGIVDDDQFVWIFGREKDVIIRGGHNIDSALIDEALARHPAVLHAAAVGRPCPSKGELPIAYVQFKPGAFATSDELASHARAHIPERAAIPVDFIALDALPMTAVGKVSKPHLRTMALESVGTALCPDRPVCVEERGGKPTLVIAAHDETDRARITQLLAPYPFTTRVDLTGALA